MSISPPPSRENYINADGKNTIRIPWSWLKWFDIAYKILCEVNREHTVKNITSNTTLDDTHGTVVVTIDGITITLPVASTARIGMEWTVIFATTGSCIVACDGNDTFPAVTSASETSVTMTGRGDSVTFKCTSSTTWGIV